MQEQRPLLADVLWFYVRLIMFGTGVVAAVVGLAGIWFLYRDIPLTWKGLTTPLFWFAMACFGLVYLSLTTLTERRWQAQALWARTPVSNEAVTGDEERRIALAWYVGAAGVLSLAGTALPWLFR